MSLALQCKRTLTTSLWGRQALCDPETGHAQGIFTCPISAGQGVCGGKGSGMEIQGTVMADTVLAHSMRLWSTGSCHHLCKSWIDSSCPGRSFPDFGETLKSWLSWILISCSSRELNSASSAQCSMSIFWSEGNKKALGNQSVSKRQTTSLGPQSAYSIQPGSA